MPKINDLDLKNWKEYGDILTDSLWSIYEAKQLTKLIRNKNRQVELNCQNKRLSFDLNDQNIICLDNEPKTYAGRQQELNLLP